MRRRAVVAGSKATIIFLIVLLARSAAGAQDGVQASNKQQVQQAQQGQDSGDRSDFLLIPALIALAAAQRQYRAQLEPSYTPPTTTTTTTTTTTVTPLAPAAAAAAWQHSSSSSGAIRQAVPAGTVPGSSAGSTWSPAGSLAGNLAGSSRGTAGSVVDLAGSSDAPAGSSRSSSSSQQTATAPKSSGKHADPAGTILDLTTGEKAAPHGIPSVHTGSTPGAAKPSAPVTPAPAPAAVTAPGKPPAYSVSPGAPNDPPGTVLIMVPGTQAAAGPPAATVSAVTPGGGSSSSSSSSSSSGGGSGGGNSLTVIEVKTTAPAGNASTAASDGDDDDDDDTGDYGSDGDMTEEVQGEDQGDDQGDDQGEDQGADQGEDLGEDQGEGQGEDQGDTDDNGEPVVSEVPAGSQQESTTLQPATPTPPASAQAQAPAPAPAPAGGMAAGAAATGAAAAPKPFVFQQAGAKSTMLIGCALPFEGNQRVVGEAVFQAARMAVMDKAPALLPGVNVNLTCINSKCIDIPTYNAVYDLAERGAVAVIGEVCSGASVAAAGVSNAKKLPIISPSSTTPSLSQPDFFFRVIPSDTYQGSAVADLVSNRGLKNIGLVYEDTAYGYGLGFSFIAAFTSLGGNVPVVVMFKRGQGNVADAIRQLRAGQGSSQYPLDGAFIATGNVTFVADLLVAAQAANLELPLFGGDSSSSPELMKLIAGRPSVIGNFTVVAPYPGDSAFLRRFSDFVKQSNADPLAAESVFAARGYDAMTALLQAYAAAQAPKNGPAIVAALQRQNFTGVSGAIAFDRNGDLVATDRTYVFGQLTPKGAVEVEDFIDISNDGGQVAARATASAGV